MAEDSSLKIAGSSEAQDELDALKEGVPDDLHQVGVLVVHGIGTQAKGTTLRDFVDPVVSLLNQHGERGAQATLNRAPLDGCVDLTTPPLGGRERQRWLIGEAWWADAFDAPDRIEVSRWLVDAGPWFLFFFVARLWRRFDVAPAHIAAGTGLGAAVAVLIWFAATSTVPGWVWAWAATALMLVVVLALVSERSRASAAVVAATVLVIYPLAALATAGMVVLWLIGLLPGTWSKKVRAFQLSLAVSVGDSYALVSSPRRKRAMFDAITKAAEELLNALGPKVPLVILAHSQGAALTYRLFSDPDFQALLVGRRVTLVTHGGAIVPIHVLEARHRGGRRWWAGWGMAGVLGLVLLVLTLGRIAASVLNSTVAATTAVSFVLAAGSLWAARRDERKTRCNDDLQPVRPPGPPPDSEPKEPLVETGLIARMLKGTWALSKQEFGKTAARAGRVGPAAGGGSWKSDGWAVCPSLPIAPGTEELRWVDIWAPWDPVPNGPIDIRRPHLGDPFGPLPAYGSGFIPCRVANNHQPWTDHVVYRTNDEEVVSRWIGEIAYRAALIPPSDVEPPRATRVTRTRRLVIGVLLLAMQGLVLAAGLAAMVWRWTELDDLGRWAVRTFPGPVRSVLGTAVDVVPKQVRNLLFGSNHDSSQLQGFLLGIAATVIGLFLVAAVASQWRNAWSARFRVKQESRAASVVAWAVATFAMFAALVGAALGIAANREPDQESRVYTVHLTVDGAAGARGVVTFQPVGKDSEAKVELEVGPHAEEVRLDEKLSYVVTANADGGKDCAVTTQGLTVTASCKAAGPVLHR